MSHRVAQIESTLQRAISQVIAKGISDPRVAGMVSITRVVVSPDLHDAFVYVSVMPEKYEKRTLAGLKHATIFIQTQVRELVALRSMPHIDFRLDVTIKKQNKVFEALNRAAQRDGQANPPEQDSSSEDSGLAPGPDSEDGAT